MSPEEREEVQRIIEQYRNSGGRTVRPGSKEDLLIRRIIELEDEG